MHRLILTTATVGLGALLASAPDAAGLGEAADVEAARMNALAGGPTNPRDAELLERYGCYSGTTARSAIVVTFTGRTIIARIGERTGNWVT